MTSAKDLPNYGRPVDGQNYHPLFWRQLRRGLGPGAAPAPLATRRDAAGDALVRRRRSTRSYPLSGRAAPAFAGSLWIVALSRLDLGRVLPFRDDPPPPLGLGRL